MDNNPIQDLRLLEAMEACRPGSDDVADPDLAYLAAYLAANPELDEIYERLQRLDAAVVKAFGDVPVPEGLAERILDRLKQAGVQPASVTPLETLPGDESVPLGEPVASVPQKQAVSRRRLLIGGAGLVLAGSLLLAVVLQGDRTVYTEALVQEMAIRFFDAESSIAGDGRLMVESPPPREFPISPQVLKHSQIRWRAVGQFLGQAGVAYDLTRPNGARATLYVIRKTVAGTPAIPPPQPALTTHNRSVAAWQSGSLLYVLVVEGNSRTYRSYLDLPRGPVAGQSCNWRDVA